MSDQQRFDFPRLAGRRVLLRAPLPSDYEWLYATAMQPRTGIRWRFRGAIPSIDQFVDFMWRGTEAQFVVCEKASGQRLGLVQLIRFSPRDRHAALSIFLSEDAEGAGWPLEALWLFVNYVFTTYDLRKLYIESLEYSVDTFRSLIGSLLEEEGRFRAHEFYDGEYLDLHILTLDRSVWRENRHHLARVVGWSEGPLDST